MRPRERQEAIRARITATGAARVEDLAAAFAVSAETIRRDLSALSEAGLLTKVHGGARRPRLAVEGSFAERLGEESAAKQAIAAKVAALVHPGETLFLDTGTTTLAAAAALAAVGGLTIVTNSARIAMRLGGSARVFLLGGAFQPDNAETTGPATLAQLEGFEADQAILGVAAVEAEAGVMDADPAEAEVARAMCARAERVVVLAHAAKLGRRAAFRICRLAEVDVLVSDAAPDETLARALAGAGVEVR